MRFVELNFFVNISSPVPQRVEVSIAASIKLAALPAVVGRIALTEPRVGRTESNEHRVEAVPPVEVIPYEYEHEFGDARDRKELTRRIVPTIAYPKSCLAKSGSNAGLTKH